MTRNFSIAWSQNEVPEPQRTGPRPPHVKTTPGALAAAAATVTQHAGPATSVGLTSVRDTIPNGTLLGIQPGELARAVRRVRAADGTPPLATHSPAPPADAAPYNEWQRFEDIGLRPSPIALKAQKLVISSYRLLGFSVLTVIVVVLIGYITSTAFYFLNHSWITPIAVSASDDKVVALQAELATQQNQRDKLLDEVAQADLAIAAEQAFELEYARAIKHDLEGREAALGRVRELASAAAAARRHIRQSNDAYAASSQQKLATDYAAGLIDRHDMLAGKYQVAQIASSNLSLAERQAEFEQRAAELATETKSLDAILDNKAASVALSYDVLKIKRDYETSKLELAKGLQHRSTLEAARLRQDKIVASVKSSAYLRALEDHSTIAFVPYGNLDKIGKGTTLYACRLGMVMCHSVGAVLEVLPGEVTFKHPKRDKQLRGQMVELKLDQDETSAAEDDMLFIGGRPLFL